MGNRADFQYIFPPPKPEEKKPAPKPVPIAEVVFQLCVIAAGVYFGLPLLALLLRLAEEFWTPYPYRSRW